MIRIDEIYYNVFVRALQHRPAVGLHWFDPFGSVDIKNICNVPPVDGTADLRIIFWDQEPVYKDTASAFFNQFCEQYQGPKIIVTSEMQSRDLDWVCDTYGLDRAYYFFHGWAALDWYRGYDHSFLIKPWMQRQIRNPLFIPNNIIGGRRTHRIHLLAQLAAKDSIRQNRISFPEICPYEKISAYDLARCHGLDISSVKLPLIIDHQREHAGNSHKIDFWDQASDCFCHVVTETAYADRLHITEKTFKPIVMQQPFIIAGSRNSLSYLKDYGFKTFDDIWDESYDQLPDDTRLEAVADLCCEISHWSENKIQQAQTKVQKTVEHNQRWFYSGFQDMLWQELSTMIEAWR